MYEALIQKVEAAAAEYDVDAVVVAGWKVEWATGAERQARSNVTRTANRLAKLQASQGRRVAAAWSPYLEGREIGTTEGMADRLAARIRSLAYAAHRLADAEAVLAHFEAEAAS